MRMKLFTKLWTTLLLLCVAGVANAQDEPVVGIQTLLEQDFTADQGEFTIDNVTLGEGLTYVWKQDAQYGMKASAYANKTNIESESWLISPEISLQTMAKTDLTFSHAINKYFGDVTKEATLWVREVGGEWKQFEISYPELGEKSFSPFEEVTINLDEFNGKTIQVGFKYTSTSTAAGTWEIKTFKIFGVMGSPEPEVKELADGKYYIGNLGAAMGLAPAYWGAGNDWGTRASLVKHPEYVVLSKLPDGAYSMDTQVSNGGENHYFGANGYMDASPALPLTITQAKQIGLADNGKPVYAYTISNGDNFFGWDGSSTILGQNIAADSENALWIIASEEEALEGLSSATAEDPMDATFLILDPNFGRNNRNKSTWQVSEDCTNKNLGGGDAKNFCAESYHSVFTVSQTIENVPNGFYGLTAQGFYRQDGEDNENLPFFFINDEKGTFPLKTGSENSMNDASNSFTKGNYTIDPIIVQVTDGKISVGVKLENNANLWCIWDNFALTYYGAETTIDEIKAASLKNGLAELQANAAAKNGQLKNEIVKAELEKAIAESIDASGLEAIQAAIEALKAAVAKADLYIEAEAKMKGIENLLEGTNVYTLEALLTYSLPYITFESKYKNGDLTAEDLATIENPEAQMGWHAANQFDDLLLSAWGVKDYESALYINTWSVEGNTDGSNFRVPFFEYWTGDDQSLAEDKWTATLENLEPGNYEVSAWVRVRIKNGAQAPAYGITMQANDGEAVNVSGGELVPNTPFNLGTFTAKGTVGEDGILKISFNIAADNNISWLSYKNVKYAVPVPVNHTWDFTKWSEATITNLKAEAAKVTVTADPDKEGNTLCTDNGALWSDHEKAEGKTCDTYAASKDNCFWAMDEESELTANGVAIAELKGLQFDPEFAKGRGLAIAVNYPETSLGTYNGPAYLWLGGKGKTCFTIPSVKGGTTIKIGVESHKNTDARGVQLFVGETQLTDPEGNAVAAPKTYTEQTWQVPAGDAVDVIVKNTNGCHIYFIDATIADEELAAAPEGWHSVISNGNLAGEENVNFYTKENSGDPMLGTIVDGAGKNGTRGLIVNTPDNPGTDWDAQFFIKSDENIPAGYKIHVEFDYMATQEAGFDTQCHAAPGDYIHWYCVESYTAKPEWQHMSKEVEVSAAKQDDNGNWNGEWGKACTNEANGKPFQTVAFNLSKVKTATIFHFDNIIFWVSDFDTSVKEIKAVNADKQGVIYNLRGQKMNGALQKGIYIQDGKKFVVK